MPGIVMLLGPTASGKTAVAMAVQDLLGQAAVSLVSVDSAMVYRGLDIGTAKPNAAELARYPHELIDIRDPAQAYTAADFVTDADAAVQRAWAAGKTPLLVGGTMLYANRFLSGIARLPTADADTRAALAAELTQRGEQAMHTELAGLDPAAAAKIAPQNHQRLLRAIEVVRLSGQPISQLWAEQAGGDVVQRLGQSAQVFALLPADRQALHQRIAVRFQQMLAAGFVDEVRGLYQRTDLHADLPSIRAVGYRQAWAMLAGKLDEPAFVAAATTATRRLAKRQLTWLRSWPDLHALQAHTVAAQAGEIAHAMQATADR